MAKYTDGYRRQQSVRYKAKIAKPNGNVTLKDVPIGNTEKAELLMEGDGQPVEFLNFMKFGEDAPAYPWGPETPFILTKEWAESYAKAVNDTPGFLYLKGHEDAETWKTRAIASGYIVGAKVIGNELYIRNYISPVELRDQTMKEIKAGLLSTSIGDSEIQTLVMDEDGNCTWFVTESIKNQTNALVEHDLSAGETGIIDTNFKQEPDGVAVENKDKGDNMSGQTTPKVETQQETFLRLKNQITSGNLAVSNLAKGLGIEVLSVEQKSGLKRLEEAEKKVGNISAYLKQVEEARKADFSTVKEAAMKLKFKDEAVYEAANEFFKLESGTKEDIEKEVERIASLKIIQGQMGAIVASINQGFAGAEIESRTGTMEA